MIKKFEKFDIDPFDEDNWDEDETEDNYYILYSYEDEQFLFFVNYNKKLYVFAGLLSKLNSIGHIDKDNMEIVKTLDNEDAVVFDYTEFYFEGDFETVGMEDVGNIKRGNIPISNNYDNRYEMLFNYSDLVKMFGDKIKFMIPHERDL